jgi:hypothetical protein
MDAIFGTSWRDVLLKDTATQALHKSQTNIKQPVHTSGVEGYPVGFV